MSSSDKFCMLVRSTLEVLSQVLEAAVLSDIGPHAEEILALLKTLVSLEPTMTVLAVQQVIHSYFESHGKGFTFLAILFIIVYCYGAILFGHLRKEMTLSNRTRCPSVRPSVRSFVHTFFF